MSVGDFLLAPDVEPVYRGHDGIRTFWRTWLAAWEEIRYEGWRFVTPATTVVALVQNQHMRGRTSGVDLQVTYAQVWTLRDGRSYAYGPSRSGRALRSVGLEAVNSPLAIAVSARRLLRIHS